MIGFAVGHDRARIAAILAHDPDRFSIAARIGEPLAVQAPARLAPGHRRLVPPGVREVSRQRPHVAAVGARGPKIECHILVNIERQALAIGTERCVFGQTVHVRKLRAAAIRYAERPDILLRGVGRVVQD